MFQKHLIFIITLIFLNIASAEPINVERIVQNVCVACHAMDGNSAITANPKLSAQHESYLYKQLMNYKSGERDNAVMAGIVANLSEEEIRGLAEYFSKQDLKLSKAISNGKGSLGEKIFRAGIKEKKVPACAGCHGPAGHGIPSKFPRLNAQHADYVKTQLQNFSAGLRANDSEKVMRMIAEKLSEKEMDAVSDYIQGLQ